MAFLYISNTNKKNILSRIDSENYFHLGLSPKGGNRLKMFTFMAALGYNQGYPSNLEGGKESFIREEYVRDASDRFKFAALYYAHTEKEHNSELSNVTQADMVYPIIDKYANTGFSVISDYMKSYTEKELAYKLIGEIDEMYEKFAQDFPED